MLMQNFGVTNKKQSGSVICWSSISMYEGDEGVSIMVYKITKIIREL